MALVHASKEQDNYRWIRFHGDLCILNHISPQCAQDGLDEIGTS